MAGGKGTRLWPLSREDTPKQFTSIGSKKTLLQQTFARAKAITRSADRIVVTTRDQYVHEVCRQLPDLPPQNVLSEPARRDTAPSVGMAAAFFAAQGRNEDCLLMVPSDHYIGDDAAFRTALTGALRVLREKHGATVLVGAKPEYPETGYGYIELGSPVVIRKNTKVHAVRRFYEKPTRTAAEKYLLSGKFLWNTGIYGWKVGTLLHLLHDFAPMIASRLDELERLFSSGASPARITSVYRRMPSISLDYAVTEQQDPSSIFVVPGDFGWGDIGSWIVFEQVVGKRSGKGGVGTIAEVHTKGNFVYTTANKAVGLAGVENLIVVVTHDAVLVCHRDHVQDVKKLVKVFEKNKKRNERYL